MFKSHYENDFSKFGVANAISDLIKDVKGDIVVLCIGTDRSTGDSLGPLVGYHLNKFSKLPVYGTIDEPVHALNLEDTVKEINKKHNNPFIISIDACLGKSTSVGEIHIDNGPLKPGAAVGKNLPEVGDINVKGIVNVGGYMELMILQNTRLSHVLKMSEVIAGGIRMSLLRKKKEDTKKVSQ